MTPSNNSFNCGDKAIDRYLRNLGYSPLKSSEKIGSWAEVGQVVKALSSRVEVISYKVIAPKKIIIKTTPAIMLVKFAKANELLGNDDFNKLNQFIFLRDGHYFVYEKVNDGWQEVTEADKITQLPKEVNNIGDVMMHAFGQIGSLRSGTVIVQNVKKIIPESKGHITEKTER